MTHGNVSNLFRGLLLAVLLVTGGIAGAETAAANLARGKKCSVFSTLQTNSFTVSGLTDGQRSGTGWSSRAFAEYADHALYPEYVVVDLGRNSRLDRVDLYPALNESLEATGFPEDFTIQVSFRGFCGAYVITVKMPDGRAGQWEAVILKGCENQRVFTVN